MLCRLAFFGNNSERVLSCIPWVEDIVPLIEVWRASFCLIIFVLAPYEFSVNRECPIVPYD